MPDITSEREMASISTTNNCSTHIHPNDEHKRDYQTGSLLYTGNTTRGFVGVMGTAGSSRSHLITRSRVFMQFDTSGVTAVPLTSKQVDDESGLVLKITPRSTSYGSPELVAVASNLTGSTTPGLANFRDITNYQVSSSFNFNETPPSGMRQVLINYTTTDDAWLQSGNGTAHYVADSPYFLSGTANLAEAMFVSSSVKMALMGYAFDYTSASISPAFSESPSALSGTVAIWFAAGGVAVGDQPTLSYTAGTTTTNILGVSPAHQAKVAGVFRGKTEKVGGKR